SLPYHLKDKSSLDASAKLTRAKPNKRSRDADLSKDKLGPESEFQRSWCVEGHVSTSDARKQTRFASKSQRTPSKNKELTRLRRSRRLEDRTITKEKARRERRAKLPRNIRVYEGNKDPEDHLDPTEIHGIKRRQNEGLQTFMDRFKSESSYIKGVPLVLRISAFMHGHGHPELAKKLNDKIPKTMDEMFERARAFIRGEVVAGSTEMIRPSQGDKGYIDPAWFGTQEQRVRPVLIWFRATPVYDLRVKDGPYGGHPKEETSTTHDVSFLAPWCSWTALCTASLDFCSQDNMSRDVLTVGFTMRIPLLYRGEYSQWVERFMNYLEEQTDGEAMINSIKNGDQSLPRVTQVSIAGTSLTEQPPLKDKSMCNKTTKDLWDALARHMLGSEYGKQDRKATVLYEYEMFKATEEELLLDTYIRCLQVINDLKKCGYSKDKYVNDAMGSKKKTVVVISDPLVLIAEKTKVSKSKEKVVVSSDSEGREYSQWVERFMNYLEEQTDREAMINSIKNGDQPSPHVTQVSTTGTSSTEQPPLKDKSMCKKTTKDLWDALARHMLGSEYGEQDRKAAVLYEYETFKATEGKLLLDTYIRYLQVISDLKKRGYSKDNCELNFKFLNNLQPEWKQYATMMRHNKNLMDINIDALYIILKQNQGDVNDAMGSKKKTVVVTFDPLALIAEKTNVSRSKEKIVVSLDFEGSEADDFSELKKITALLAKAFNRRKFYSKPTNNNLRTLSTFQSANKKQEFVNTDNKKVEKKDDEKNVRRPKHKDFIWKKKWSSNASNAALSSVSHLKLKKDVKRHFRKDLLSCNNSHIGETSSAFVCNDAMNVSSDSRMNDLLDDNNFFIFDDESVKISLVSKMPFRKKPRDSMNVRSKSNMIKSLPRTVRLPKMKFEKDYLCSACEQGKIYQKHYKSKMAFASNKPLYLIHMDLCGPMRVQSINGKRYALVVVDDYSRYTWVFFLHSKDKAFEVIISFIKKTQVNLQLQVHHVRTDNGTEFKNKTLAKFFDEDVGKLKAKRDIGVFVGYSKESHAFRIYNKRTRKIHESVNVNFDEISEMASKQFTLEPGLSKLNKTGKSLNPLVSKVSEASKKDLEDLFQDFYDEYFDSSKIMKSSTTNVETLIINEVFHEVSELFQGESSSSSLNDDMELSPKEVILPQTNTQSILNNMIPNGDEASTSHNVFNESLEDAYFDASTSFQGLSNVHIYYQPYPHEKKWTKDHPLHKIIGDPKSSVRTRGQLANSCLFLCLLSSIEPANVAEALRDVDWVNAMQEELD
nr:retrovirus-related Pol polyprotein from transposon TNT 1-94 [Tanacetum cinerariifolium]